MSDPGTRFADKKQEEIEKRIHSIYQEATADIVKRLDQHSRKLYANDAKKRQQVKTGGLTKEAYKEWLRNQLLIEKIWNDQIDSATEVLLHANQTAVNIVNGERKAVFAENANYTAYAMEKEARMDLSFTLYDDAAMTRLLRDEPQLLPPKKVDEGKDVAWNREKISAVIARGIISGSDIPTIARNIGTETGSSNEKAMTRYARTAMTGAQNAGRIQMLNEAQDMGIKVKKIWLATMDERTRPAHQDLDGQTAEVNEPFSSMLGPIMYPGDPSADEANTWNCFVGDTRISTDSTIVRSYKHDYSGLLCTIKTARGIEFTCTPNHPILTPFGWVGAHLLHEGSDIIIASIGESDFLRVDPDINHVFPSMEAFHDSLKESPAERTTSSHVDFHGDRPTSDVEIISKERLLRKHRNPFTGQRSYKLPFKFAAPFVLAKGHLMPCFREINITSLGFMGGTCKPLSFFLRRLCHAVIHGFRAVSRSNSAVLQTQDDSISSDSKLLRKRLDRFPGRILTDKVISINVSSVSHVPVYNLQTDNEYYFVNPILECKDGRSNYISVISHNCRCTLTYEYQDYKYKGTRYDQEAGETMPDMTYEEWKTSKEGGFYESARKLKETLDALQNQVVANGAEKVFSGIWKDDVTYADYTAKQPTIAAKYNYYAQAMARAQATGNTAEYERLSGLMSQLVEFENNGKQNEKLLKERDAALKMYQKEFTSHQSQQSGQFASNAWDDSTKQAALRFRSRTDADKYYRPELDEQWKTLSDAEKYGVWEYTHNSNPMNKSLAGYHESWSRSDYIGPENTEWGHENNYRTITTPDFKQFAENGHVNFRKAITDLTTAIDKASFGEGTYLVRGSDEGGLAGMIEASGLVDFKTAQSLLNNPTKEQDVRTLLIGERIKNNSFTSTGISSDAGLSGSVKYSIYAPKGTHGIYAEPQSYYGNTSSQKMYKPGASYRSVGGEAEVILQRGTEYVVRDIKYEGLQWKVELDIVRQPEYFQHGDEDTYNDGATRHTK